MKPNNPLPAFILCIPLICFGQVYKTVDEYGNVTYSDTPSKSAEKIKLQTVNTQPAITPIPKAPKKTKVQITKSSPPLKQAPLAEPPPRTKPGLKIALPKNGSTISSNAEIITLILLTPKPLPSGHHFQAILDGNTVGAPTRSNNISIKIPKSLKGSTTLSAVIKDENGRSIENTDIINIIIE